MDVNLNPELETTCRHDLGEFCSHTPHQEGTVSNFLLLPFFFFFLFRRISRKKIIKVDKILYGYIKCPNKQHVIVKYSCFK